VCPEADRSAVQLRSVASPCISVQADGSRQLAGLIRGRVRYCIQHHRALDVRAALEGVVALLSSLTAVGKPSSQARHGSGRGAPDAAAWQEQLLLAFQLLLQTVGEPSRAPLPFIAQLASYLPVWPS